MNAQIVPEHRRVAITAEIFGTRFPFAIEPVIFDFAGDLSEDYAGGSWDFFTLENGGFFMCPKSPARFQVESPNGNSANMSKEAFGIAVCLFAYSNLSFDPALSDHCGTMFHLVREYALEHSEVSEILRIID